MEKLPCLVLKEHLCVAVAYFGNVLALTDRVRIRVAMDPPVASSQTRVLVAFYHPPANRTVGHVGVRHVEAHHVADDHVGTDHVEADHVGVGLCHQRVACMAGAIRLV